MKKSLEHQTSLTVPRVVGEAYGKESRRKPLLTRLCFATTISLLLAAGHLAAAQAGDYATVWRTMKPLYAVSFDVGGKHVLSYFMSKVDHCDLTLMVTERPSQVRQEKEIPKLKTARFTAAVYNGRSARFDTGEGRALEYACATSARTMRVRKVNQIAIASPLAE